MLGDWQRDLHVGKPSCIRGINIHNGLSHSTMPFLILCGLLNMLMKGHVCHQKHQLPFLCKNTLHRNRSQKNHKPIYIRVKLPHHMHAKPMHALDCLYTMNWQTIKTLLTHLDEFFICNHILYDIENS